MGRSAGRARWTETGRIEVWRLRSNLSLNLGLRYEMNDGVDGLGNKTAEPVDNTPKTVMSFQSAVMSKSSSPLINIICDPFYKAR